MANEITLSINIRVVNGNVSKSNPAVANTFDQSAGGNVSEPSFTIGTSEETISFGDITPGWVFFENEDDTNFIELGFATSTYIAELPPNNGSFGPFYIKTGVSVYVKADTAACQLRCFFIDA